jgi:hypothetical protein
MTQATSKRVATIPEQDAVQAAYLEKQFEDLGIYTTTVRCQKSGDEPLFKVSFCALTEYEAKQLIASVGESDDLLNILI